MKYFLIEYDRRARHLVRTREFGGDTEVRAATEARLEAELAAFRAGQDIEVVLLEAPSLDVLRQTHRSYFQEVEDYFPAEAVG